MPITIPDPATEGDSDLTLPTRKEVCHECNGEGQSSAYLGSFSREDLDNDPDFAESYFAGHYDRTCTVCNGLRVVDVVDEARLTPEELKAWQDHCTEVRETRQMYEMERRMGA